MRVVIFWGWGKKSVQRQVGPYQIVKLVYSYFHLMFAFTIAWGGQYVVASATPQGWAERPASAEEARYLLGGQELKPSPWARFSLMGLIAAVVLLVVISSLTRRH